MVGLANLIAIFHDASCLTVENDAVLSHGDLVDACGFGE